jgi:hypothetical protein
MPRYLNVYNLNWRGDEGFDPFTVLGYRFEPTSVTGPAASITPREDRSNRWYRVSRISARVYPPPTQEEAVTRRGGLSSRRRKLTILDDILLVMSILIGRNVALAAHRPYPAFPTTAGNHADLFSPDSRHLENSLQLAVGRITTLNWQKWYEDGFHVRMFLNNSNINAEEARFLSNVKVWEFVYANELKPLPDSPLPDLYEKLRATCLDTKLTTLIRRHFLNRRNLKKDKVLPIVHIRNQLTHYGRLPVTIPDAPAWLKALDYDGIRQYLQLFDCLTQFLVLRTLGIDDVSWWDRIWGVKEALHSLVTKDQL